MAKTPRPLIAGNWKMNGLRSPSLREAKTLARHLDGKRAACDVLICPPATLLLPLKEAVKGSRIMLGGQDCHQEAAGAHTGDISAVMLADAGCRYVIVGHSERRTDHQEASTLIAKKAQAAKEAGLIAIVCVGETARERKAGKALDVVGEQLRRSLPKGCTAADTVIAYEPVWAIGSGRTPTSRDVGEVHAFIRSRLKRRFGQEGLLMRVLYGGSVKAGNAEELLAVDNVDGALVGGASLTAKDFWGIISTQI
jgi:triosephosphate isomerase